MTQWAGQGTDNPLSTASQDDENNNAGKCNASNNAVLDGNKIELVAKEMNVVLLKSQSSCPPTDTGPGADTDNETAKSDSDLFLSPKCKKRKRKSNSPL